MPLSYFLCPMKRKTVMGRQARYCAMDDFTQQVSKWEAVEVLGDQNVCKVSAANVVLNAIGNTATFRRIPLGALDNPISDLNTQQRNALKTELINAGYSLSEVNARFPDIARATLGEVLRFLAQRRKEAHYDEPTNNVVLDGPDIPCESIDVMDAKVT